MRKCQTLLALGLSTALSACMQSGEKVSVVYKGNEFFGKTNTLQVAERAKGGFSMPFTPEFGNVSQAEPASLSNVGVSELPPISSVDLESIAPKPSKPNTPTVAVASVKPAPSTNRLLPPVSWENAIAAADAKAKPVAPAHSAPAQIAQKDAFLPPSLPEKTPATAPQEAKQPTGAEEILAGRLEVPAYNALETGKASPSKTVQFIWPADGKVISKFGSQPGGLYNDGINISSKEGEPIWAASDGTVAYAGNELKGYGNMAILRHDGNWMTAYAHASRLSVKKGDHVRQGDLIGYVGSTGGVDHAQLHFGIRKGKDPVDPEKYLQQNMANLGKTSLQ